VALEEHKPSMARERWKSTCAKVEIGLLIELRLYRCSKTSKDPVTSQPKDCLHCKARRSITHHADSMVPNIAQPPSPGWAFFSRQFSAAKFIQP
jgi:hypothetical protein